METALQGAASVANIAVVFDFSDIGAASVAQIAVVFDLADRDTRAVSYAAAGVDPADKNAASVPHGAVSKLSEIAAAGISDVTVRFDASHRGAAFAPDSKPACLLGGYGATKGNDPSHCQKGCVVCFHL